jgi:MFS family permease
MQMEGSGTSRFWYHGWNVVAVCILSQVAANGLTYNALSLFLPGWSKELHTPVSKLQLVTVAVMALVSAGLSPFVGTLADKYPARPLFALGLLGMAAFYAAISMVTEAWQIAALYGLLVPLALCLSTAIVANALISRWFVRRVGLALGLSAFGIGMAGVVLPPVIATLLPEVGWRMIWRGGALLLAVVVMPIVVWMARDRPTAAEGAHYLHGDGQPARHAGHGAGHGSAANQLGWREVLTRRNFWLLVGIYLPIMALYGGCGQNLAPLAASHGLSQQAAGTLIAVLSFSHVISTLVLGLLSDRFGNRLPFAGLALVVVAGAVTVAFGSGLLVLGVGCALIGFGGGEFTLLAAAIATEFGAAGVGRAFGLCMAFIPLSALTPWAIARTQETTGSYAPALLGFSVLVLGAGFLSLLLRERRSPRQPAQVPMQAATPDIR